MRIKNTGIMLTYTKERKAGLGNYLPTVVYEYVHHLLINYIYRHQSKMSSCKKIDL
jgi:hypothetical protein